MMADNEIEKMNEEIKAIRAAFQQNAANIDVYTSTTIFTTSKNRTSWSNSQPYNPLEWGALTSMATEPDGNKLGPETIEVTFDCDKGINTFASLEIEGISVNPRSWGIFTCRRIPYSGGARWLVIIQPNITINAQGRYIWSPSIVKFAVQSMAPGVLGVKMLWQ